MVGKGGKEREREVKRMGKLYEDKCVTLKFTGLQDSMLAKPFTLKDCTESLPSSTHGHTNPKSLGILCLRLQYPPIQIIRIPGIRVFYHFYLIMMFPKIELRPRSAQVFH